MLTYCNLYKTKNHQILNKFLKNKQIDVANNSEDYKYEDSFSFLTKQEFNVIYELFVNKRKRKDLAKEIKVSIYKLKEIEYRAKIKLSKHFNISLIEI